MPGPTQDVNPLLQLQWLPPFDAIRPEHVVPAIRKLIEETRSAFSALEISVQPTWEGLVEPLEKVTENLGRAWGIVGHLMGVQNSAELRTAHEEVQGDVVQLFTAMGQSRPVYEAARALRDGKSWAGLAQPQQRILERMIRDAELGGVGLEGEQRERFNAIAARLAELSTQFSNSVLDATKAFGLMLRDSGDVDGLPPSLRDLAAQAARDAGEENADSENGPWRITLDYPSFGPFLQHARRRDLREQVYRAFVSRASEGEQDNRPRIEEILRLRREKSELLGFRDFAEVSLSRKMAASVDEVATLLEELRSVAYPAAQRELEELRTFVRERDAAAAESLELWDITYWAERMREERFSFQDEDLRPYFPMPKVLEGLFALARELFGVEIEAADSEAQTWHPDVRFFRIRAEGGEPIAAFYLDAYSRPAEKRGGAWMDECVGRSRLFLPPGEDLRLPVAYLVCNGTPPVGDRPSLMTFREVETLFHEFGHGLQHMLTTVDFDGAAGISGVEWDAVELPSQFMENWCYHEPTLRGFSGHWETGEPLPQDLFQKILAARTYRAGTDTLRQLYFALTDMALHHEYVPGESAEPDAFAVQRRISERTTVVPPLPEDRFLCSFSHIFAGGYAAGYYSYKWAEVLSADAFGAFEEAGLEDPEAIRSTGRRFRDTVLSLGGGQHPMDVFVAFRGRRPDTAALLRHSGLAS